MPLPSTMTPIATQTLASTASSISFSNIPQTYTDLVLVFNGGMNTTTGYGLALRVNGDTGSSYSSTRLYGTVLSASSDRLSNTTMIYSLMQATNTLGSMETIIFPNYSNSSVYKTVLFRTTSRGWEGGGSSGVVAATVGLWRSTSAINSITFSPEFTASWISGSTATLYGIKAA